MYFALAHIQGYMEMEDDKGNKVTEVLMPGDNSFTVPLRIERFNAELERQVLAHGYSQDLVIGTPEPEPVTTQELAGQDLDAIFSSEDEIPF